MIQYIEFFVTAHNKFSAERVRFALGNLKSQVAVKKWVEKEDEDSVHFSVLGSWTAYSTISAMIPKKKTPETANLLISIEHFEDDN